MIWRQNNSLFSSKPHWRGRGVYTEACLSSQVFVLRLDCFWSQERKISHGVERFWEEGVGGAKRDRGRMAGAPTPLRGKGGERQLEGGQRSE